MRIKKTEFNSQMKVAWTNGIEHTNESTLINNNIAKMKEGSVGSVIMKSSK